MSCEACGVGENIVIGVSIFHGRVGILPEAVEEEDCAEGNGGGEDEEGAREEGRHFDASDSRGDWGNWQSRMGLHRPQRRSEVCMSSSE